MVLVMVLHIRSKYTAVGRKEIVTFFYLYAVVELLSLFLDSSIIPASSNVYPVSHYIPLHFLVAVLMLPLRCTVVRRHSHWIHLRRLLVSARQWIRRIPIRGGWNPFEFMG